MREPPKPPAAAAPAVERAHATCLAWSRVAADPLARSRLARALLWVVPLVWSSNYLIARAAGPFVPPHLLAFGRWSIVFAVLLAFNGRSLLAKREHVRREWKRCLVLGGLGMWICGAWVYLGGHSTSATNIGLLYAAAPVGIALGGQRLLGERLTTRQRVGMAMAPAGVVFILARGDLGVLRATRFSAGDLWILAATVAWIAYSLLLLAWPTVLCAAERLCCICAGGLVLLLPFVVFECLTQPVALDVRGIGLIVLAGLLPGLLSYLAYGFMLRELGAGTASLVMYLAPLYGSALAWWLLDEPPQWFHGVGALLVLPAIHVANRGARTFSRPSGN